MKWFQLHPKVRAALGVAVTAVGASALGAWNGTTTWHETGAAAIVAFVTVLGAYFAPVSPDA